MVSTKKNAAKAGKTAAQAHVQRADNQFEPTPPATPRSKKSAAPKEWNYTHLPPTASDRAKNGRHEGRNLITWTRPRMAEKLLLHLQYECSRRKVDIPWDSIAHRLHPGSSGGAILQHLNRLRGHLVAEGHMVPPICQKPGSRVVVEPTIRGYIRKFPEGDDAISTRPVPFSEPLDDRKFNLPDAVDQLDVPASVKRENMGGNGIGRKPAIKNEPSPSPSDLNSNEMFAVGAASSKPRRGFARAAKKQITYTADEHDLYDGGVEDLDQEGIAPEIPCGDGFVMHNHLNAQVDEDDEAANIEGLQQFQGNFVEYEDDNQTFVHSQHSVQSLGRLHAVQVGEDAAGFSVHNANANAYNGNRAQAGYVQAAITGHPVTNYSPGNVQVMHNQHIGWPNNNFRNPEDEADEGFVPCYDDGTATPHDVIPAQNFAENEPQGHLMPYYANGANVQPQQVQESEYEFEDEDEGEDVGEDDEESEEQYDDADDDDDDDYDDEAQ